MSTGKGVVGGLAKTLLDEGAKPVERSVFPPGTPEPLDAGSLIPELPEGQMPPRYQLSPRHTARVVRPAGDAQLNARVSTAARYVADEFLGSLKREGRPTYMYELLDVLLLNLRRPEFAQQVRELLDTTEIE